MLDLSSAMLDRRSCKRDQRKTSRERWKTLKLRSRVQPNIVTHDTQKALGKRLVSTERSQFRTVGCRFLAGPRGAGPRDTERRVPSHLRQVIAEPAGSYLGRPDARIDLSMLASHTTPGAHVRIDTKRISEVFSPGFAVRGRLREASLQVRPLSQRSVGCRLPGACAEGPRPKSLTTRRNPDQRRRPRPSTGCGFLVRKPHCAHRPAGRLRPPDAPLRRLCPAVHRLPHPRRDADLLQKGDDVGQDLILQRHLFVACTETAAQGFKGPLRDSCVAHRCRRSCSRRSASATAVLIP